MTSRKGGQRFDLLGLLVLSIAFVPSSQLQAQNFCTGSSLPLWFQGIAETLTTLQPPCSFTNCVTPQVSFPVLRPVPVGGGAYRIELVLDVRAPENHANVDDNVNGTLDILWATGSTVPVFTTNFCEHTLTDRVESFLRLGNVTCAQVPTTLGTYSARAQVCGGPLVGCGRFTERLAKVSTITEVGVGGAPSLVWRYLWFEHDLDHIDRPDGTSLVFSYGDPGLPGFLTRVELVNTFAFFSRQINYVPRVMRGWEYDQSGNVLQSWKGAATFSDAAAIEKWSFAYDSASNPQLVTVTDPLGAVSTRLIGRDTGSSKPKLTASTGDCPTCGNIGPHSQLIYADPAHPLRPTRMIDGKGHITDLAYDAFGQVLTRTEAATTPLERTTEFSYGATYPALIESVARPSASR